MKTRLNKWLEQNMLGHKEWDGVISACQMWYYGSVQKSAWCATSVSWAAYHSGILHQIGGKNENVYQMLLDCSSSGYGEILQGNAHKIKEGDILFFNWDSGKMSYTSSKHVTVAAEDCTGDMIKCIGGNQDDMCKYSTYERKYLYAIFRPNYKED